MKIAAQMYSVRNTVAEKGYGNAMKELAKIGFTSVEHACGFQEFDGKPEELRKFMDDLGITMLGTHVGSDCLFDPEKRKQTVELYAKLGAKYLISPWEDQSYDYETMPVFNEKMNEAAEYLKQFGMFCGYHNHVNEFLTNPLTGKSYWESFAEGTAQDVVLEQDCGWSTFASQDAAALIRKFPGRSKVLHLKPAVRIAHRGIKQEVLGKDSVPWADVLKAAQEVGGTEYLVVEQEWYLPGTTDMESIAESFAGLKELM